MNKSNAIYQPIYVEKNNEEVQIDLDNINKNHEHHKIMGAYNYPMVVNDKGLTDVIKTSIKRISEHTETEDLEKKASKLTEILFYCIIIYFSLQIIMWSMVVVLWILDIDDNINNMDILMFFSLFSGFAIIPYFLSYYNNTIVDLIRYARIFGIISLFVNLCLAIYRLVMCIVCILGGKPFPSNQVDCHEYIGADWVAFGIIAMLTVMDVIITTILFKLYQVQIQRALTGQLILENKRIVFLRLEALTKFFTFLNGLFICMSVVILFTTWIAQDGSSNNLETIVISTFKLSIQIFILLLSLQLIFSYSYKVDPSLMIVVCFVTIPIMLFFLFIHLVNLVYCNLDMDPPILSKYPECQTFMATNWIHFAFSIVFLFINMILMILATLHLDEYTFIFRVMKESVIMQNIKKYESEKIQSSSSSSLSSNKKNKNNSKMISSESNYNIYNKSNRKIESICRQK